MEGTGGTKSRISWGVWLPSAVWVAFGFFYVVTASQVIQSSFYLAIRGMGILQYPSSIVLFSKSLDSELLLVSGTVLLLVQALLFRNRGMSDPLAIASSVALAAGLVGFLTLSPLFLALVGVAGVLLIVEGSSRLPSELDVGSLRPFYLLALALVFVISLLAALRWIVGGIDGSVPFGDASWGSAEVGAQAVGLLYPILPELALLFFFSWAIRLLLASELHPIEWGATGELGSSYPGWAPWALLAGGAGVVLLVGAYPYLPAVNPNSILVGVDVRDCYAYWLKGTPGSTVCGPFGFAIGNERIGALWLLQGMTQILGSPDLALKAAPPLLGVLLIVSTYALVKEGTGDGFLAGVAGILTAVSMQVVAAIDSGTLANWLGVSVAFLFFAVVLRGIRKKSFFYLVPAFGLIAALLFIHPWTWAAVLSVLTLFLAADLVQAGATGHLGTKKFEAVLGASLLVLGLAADFYKSGLPSGSGLVVAVRTVLPYLSLTNALQVASNLQQSFTLYLGGAQANPVWFLLGAVGVLSLPDLRQSFSKLMIIWVFAISIGVLFVGPPTSLLQSRMMFDVPLQIFGAIGLVAILRRLTAGMESRSSGLVMFIGLGAVVALELSFALDYVGFLYQ